MTDELLQQANKLSHAINDLEAKIQIVEAMHHYDVGLQIQCEDIGMITIAYDDELKDDILNMMWEHLNKDKGDAEDAYRML